MKKRKLTRGDVIILYIRRWRLAGEKLDEMSLEESLAEFKPITPEGMRKVTNGYIIFANLVLHPRQNDIPLGRDHYFLATRLENALLLMRVGRKRKLIEV